MSAPTDLPPLAETVHVVDLTDEELIGLDGLESDHVAPLPWLGGHTPEQTALAAQVGLRSLLAHGLPGEGDAVTLPEDLEPTLNLRNDAQTIVYADHSTPSQQETRILYIHPHVVLSEHVNGGGIHRFFLGNLSCTTADLMMWCEPQRHQVEEHDGDADLPPELHGLQSVVFLDVVTLAGEAAGGEGVETRSLTLYRLANGSAVEALDETDALDLAPLGVEELRRRVWETVVGPTGLPLPN